MAGRVVTVKVDFSKYKFVDLSLDDAELFINELGRVLGRTTNDMREVIRYVKNFNEFYEYARKKFKDYIALPHRPDDYIKGEAIIDKVKLYRSSDGEPRIIIVIDRKVPLDVLEKTIKAMGYEVEVVKEF